MIIKKMMKKSEHKDPIPKCLQFYSKLEDSFGLTANTRNTLVLAIAAKCFKKNSFKNILTA